MSKEFLELLQSVEERRSPGRENSSWETVEHGVDVKGEPLRWSDRENKVKQKTSKQTKNKNQASEQFCSCMRVTAGQDHDCTSSL